MINDSKQKIKNKIRKYLRKKIVESDNLLKSKKFKSGRPNYLSINKCLDAIFYVLFEGVSWEIASKLATGKISYKSTIHRLTDVSQSIFKLD